MAAEKNWREMSGDELLGRIPDELLDVPVTELDGQTPREAAKQDMCYMCRNTLYLIGNDWGAFGFQTD